MAEGQATVWCLLGRKAGDNTQVRALAEELGLGYEEKQVRARPWELLVHCGGGATLAGIDRAASSPLRPPWPALVLTAGRRNEPVARWIAQQSGGKTRLVHIGRPWAPLSNWDMVVTTPQYFLPRQDNILHNALPLHRVSAPDMQAAGAGLLPQIAHLPRPWIALLMGGDSGRFVMTAAKGARLGTLARDLARAAGGTVLATDSPRTPASAGDAMQSALGPGHTVHRYTQGADNPYQGLLALADAFVVTGESMSMLGEAAATGRPLFIFDVGDGARPWWTLAHNYRYKPLSFHLGMGLGPARMRRDIGRIQQALIDSGRAQWLCADSVRTAGPALHDLDVAAASGQSGAGEDARRELHCAAQAVRQLLIPR